MDHTRELARILRKTQDLHLATTRPPLWFVEGVFNGEEVPEPPAGICSVDPAGLLVFWYSSFVMRVLHPVIGCKHAFGTPPSMFVYYSRVVVFFLSKSIRLIRALLIQ